MIKYYWKNFIININSKVIFKKKKDIHTNELRDIKSSLKLDKNLETHVAVRRSIDHQEKLKNRLSKKHERKKKVEATYRD